MSNWKDVLGQVLNEHEMWLVEKSIKNAVVFEDLWADTSLQVALPASVFPLIATLALGYKGVETIPENGAKKVIPPTNIIDLLPWNHKARWPFPEKLRPLSQIEYITIHHSGRTPRNKTSIEAWNLYHTRTKSWSHVGYHFAIASMIPVTQGGEIKLYQLNRMDQVTWHDSSNYRTLGLVFAGGFLPEIDVGPSAEQLELFGQFAAWVMPKLPNLKAFVPHNYWQRSTQCPGSWEQYKPALVEAAQSYGVDISERMGTKATRLSAPSFVRSGLQFPRQARALLKLQEDV